MAFWKKSEDPWDRKPPRVTCSAPEEPYPGQREEGFLKSIWSEVNDWRQEKKAAVAAEAEKPPENCPWCGREMEQGFLMGGKGVFWCRGVPSGKSLWFGYGRENTMRVDVEGGFLTPYQTAWYCPDCKKMTIDAADLRTRAEENDLFPRWTEDAEQGEEEV